MKTIVAILTSLMMLSACDASWFCKKGKPCGRACIEKSKTCHKD